jgi:chromate transporter
MGQAILHGLKLVALSVVAFGLIGMTRSLCPDLSRRLIAIMAAVILLSIGQAWAQLLVVGLGALSGALVCRSVRPDFESDFAVPFGTRTGWLLITGFVVLLVCLPVAAQKQQGLLAYADAFFRTGALAFGGGHVVLPLLQNAVVKPGWISSADFLAGYGAAQAVPGPMFALSAYLGARLPGSNGGLLGAVIALIATFLPGFLLAAGILPLWRTLALHPIAARAIAGICAAVVGMLAAALYDPLWVSAVHAPSDVLVAALGLLVLTRWSTAALPVVFLCVALSVAFNLI